MFHRNFTFRRVLLYSALLILAFLLIPLSKAGLSQSYPALYLGSRYIIFFCQVMMMYQLGLVLRCIQHGRPDAFFQYVDSKIDSAKWIDQVRVVAILGQMVGNRYGARITGTNFQKSLKL
jgi:hypothetical protein